MIRIGLASAEPGKARAAFAYAVVAALTPTVPAEAVLALAVPAEAVKEIRHG